MGNSISAVANAFIATKLGVQKLKELEEFTREVRQSNRSFPSKASASIVEEIIDYAKRNKSHSFAESDRFYRARKNTPDMKKEPYPIDKMGAPPPEKSISGRLNPSGVPFLYLADHIDTTIAEVCPQVGNFVTVAEFFITKKVNVINFSKKHFIDANPDYRVNEFELIWREGVVADLLSKPVDDSDNTAYKPTQYLAQRILEKGFDGILYDSALKPNGYNVVLFDAGNAQIGNREIYVTEIKAISYRIGDTAHYSLSNT